LDSIWKIIFSYYCLLSWEAWWLFWFCNFSWSRVDYKWIKGL